MACPDCQRRAALIAALAPAIFRMALTRQDLLGLLALPDEQLLHATQVEDSERRVQLAEIPWVNQSGPTAVCRHEPDYPPTLAQLPSAPAVLHATCTSQRLRELITEPTVAIVGSRAHTSYAHEMTFALAHDLAAAGVTIISGVNHGLEGIAHHGVIDARGQAVAVMPGPAERPYPVQSEHLYRCIRARGAAVSEFPPGFSPIRPWCSTAGQRIIAALASIVVVVEAGMRSSALLAARIASDLGRDIAVVPGRVTDVNFLGTFGLLRDGAHPVANAQDVLDLIPKPRRPGRGAESPRVRPTARASPAPIAQLGPGRPRSGSLAESGSRERGSSEPSHVVRSVRRR